MAQELKACPFCGQSDFLIERLDNCSSVVICQGMVDEHSACLAQGPVAIQDDDGEEQPGRDAAIREWNTRDQLPSQGGEAVAWRVTGRDGLTVTAQYPEWAEADRLLTITPLYTHPADQVADPVLERPAKVGAGTFSAGLPQRMVVEAAYRQYEYAQDPPFSDEQISALAKTFCANNP